MGIETTTQWLWRYKWYLILFLITTYLIVSISNYYATTFTDLNISMIPNDALLYHFTNNFNAYTEMVSTNSTTEGNYQNFQYNMLGTLVVIFIGYASLLAFSVTYGLWNAIRRRAESGNRFGGSYLAVIYFVSSVVAAGATDIIHFLQGKFLTGVSYFGVDGSAITLVFSVLSVAIVVMFVRFKIKHANTNMKLIYLFGGILYIAIFAVLFWLFSILMIQYLSGLPTIDTDAHSLDLILFAILFVAFVMFRSMGKRTFIRQTLDREKPLGIGIILGMIIVIIGGFSFL